MRYFPLLFKIFFSFFFICQLSYASPCSEDIQYELALMKLDPDIKNNKQLIDNVAFFYGDAFVNSLILQHPFLHENPSYPIDERTLTWVHDEIWSIHNNHVQYLYIAGDLETEEALETFVLIMDGNFLSKRRIVPVFQFEESGGVFHSLLKVGNEIDLSNILNKVYPNVTPVELVLIQQKFLAHFRKFNQYHVTFKFITQESPIIQIVGHGDAGKPAFFFGNRFVSSRDIVISLKDMKLPNNATIKLLGCYTACDSKSILLTKQQVKEYFFSDRINEIYNNGQSESFLKNFHREMMQSIPLYSGSIHGYIGGITHSIFPDVLTKDGKKIMTYASIIESSNGTVYLKREQSRLTLRGGHWQ